MAWTLADVLALALLTTLLRILLVIRQATHFEKKIDNNGVSNRKELERNLIVINAGHPLTALSGIPVTSWVERFPFAGCRHAWQPLDIGFLPQANCHGSTFGIVPSLRYAECLFCILHTYLLDILPIRILAFVTPAATSC